MFHKIIINGSAVHPLTATHMSFPLCVNGAYMRVSTTSTEGEIKFEGKQCRHEHARDIIDYTAHMRYTLTPTQALTITLTFITI